MNKKPNLEEIMAMSENDIRELDDFHRDFYKGKIELANNDAKIKLLSSVHHLVMENE